MRVSVDLLNDSLSYLNPLKERELDLRGNKIPIIENLGGVSEHDAIDFTDNDIPAVAGFPLMPRLRTLLLARNRISNISLGLERSIPNLRTLVLESNRVTELADLDALASLRRLQHLVLMGNPVCKKEHYRHWVIWRVPTVRFLDYQKVKEVDRIEAKGLFGTEGDPSHLAKSILHQRSQDVRMADAFSATNGRSAQSDLLAMTDEQREQVKQRIRSARTLDEAMKLEAALREGRISGALLE